MNKFLRNGRGMPTDQTDPVTAYSIKFTTSYILPMIFCVLFSWSLVTPAHGQEADGLNNIKPLKIGDAIPESLWNLPLQVVNQPDGKDTITLNDYRDKKLIILDFWATWCAPCVKSIVKWDNIYSQLNNDLTVLGIHVGDYGNIDEYMRNKEWELASIIEPSTSELISSFFTKPVVSRIIWIYEGRIFSITGLKGYDINDVRNILNGGNVVLPINLDWTHYQEVAR